MATRAAALVLLASGSLALQLAPEEVAQPLLQSQPESQALTFFATEPDGPSCLEASSRRVLENETIPSMIADGWHHWTGAHVRQGTCVGAGYAFSPFAHVWGATETFKDRIGRLGHFLTELKNHPTRLPMLAPGIIEDVTHLPEMQSLLRSIRV
mmetsp:Transcript_83924/g.195235  ORF Transcript_83924/g.195235 Transcript_83924/m.195235 type:complete len:154 (-) Transcript_83924:69-530(-)|eukprot:CAMPEP_0171094356 /NCGR_PEP_ID=MMETSP0766_2-20121228/40841_1 /TAXON_ID=439317 /ORGANISM="Gambierdiscus australes, Strain CAWD 149" /LENGTH=153 /DNA_ID=CAMNT_0011552971 /DNA_START=50 /DNA_END=511 /DNA_ORIENTATION=+